MSKKISLLTGSFLAFVVFLLFNLSGCGASSPTSTGGGSTTPTGLSALSSGSTSANKGEKDKDKGKKKKGDKEASEQNESNDENTQGGNTGAGNGNASGTAIITTPIGVTATAISATQINVGWNVASGAVGYNIYRSITPNVTVSPVNKVNTTPSLAGPFGNTGLTPATTYYYVVASVNASGAESGASVVVSATTGVFPPPAPIGVSATPVSTTQINLNWNLASGAVGYNIYRSTTPNVAISPANKVNATPSLAGPFGNTGLIPATTYYYVLTSIDANGVESVASIEVNATTAGLPPAAPTGVSATASTGQNIVSWSPVTGATSYNIYWSTTLGVTPATGTLIASATTPYTHTGLTAGTTYYYVVTAVNANGESLPSVQVSGVPLFVISNRAYITNTSGFVTVVDIRTNTPITNITVGSIPKHLAINYSTNKIYVANTLSNNISVIDALTNTVIATINVGLEPTRITINETTNKIYVTNRLSDSVSVIDGFTNNIVSTIKVGGMPIGISVNQNTNKIYVCNSLSTTNFKRIGQPLTITDGDTISIIDGATDVVLGFIPLTLTYNTPLKAPNDIVINTLSDRAYVTCSSSGEIAVLDIVNNKVLAFINAQQPGNLNNMTVNNLDYMLLDQKNGKIYVSSGFFNDIFIIDINTNTMLNLVNAVGVGGYNAPLGMALYPPNNGVYIVLTTATLLRLDTTLYTINTIASFGWGYAHIAIIP